MKWLCLIAAWVGGILAAVVLFVGITVAATELFALWDWYGGHGAGIFVLFLAPVAVPIFAGIGIMGGITTGFFLNRKMQSRIQRTNQKGPVS